MALARGLNQAGLRAINAGSAAEAQDQTFADFVAAQDVEYAGSGFERARCQE